MSLTWRATPIRRVSLSMKVPTLLFGTQLSQMPDSGREANHAHVCSCEHKYSSFHRQNVTYASLREM